MIDIHRIAKYVFADSASMVQGGACEESSAATVQWNGRGRLDDLARLGVQGGGDWAARVLSPAHRLLSEWGWFCGGS